MALNIATLVARVVADTSGFNAGMARTESRLAQTGETMRRTGRTMTTSLTLPIIATAAAATKMAIDFQQQLEMIHTQAGASQAEVNRLHDAVLSLAPATRYGPEELTKALYHIESVGARGKTAMDILKVAAQGAATGNADLESTASALVGTMRVFHTPASQAASVMGDLNAVVGAGNMRMQDLNNAIGTGLLPTAQGLGLNIREVGAALAVMTDESTPAQVAATRMRTLLLLMSGETQKSVDVLKKLGIGSLEMGHLMHQPGGMIPALQLLKTHLDAITKDPTLQTQFLAKAFGGARSSGTIIQLLNNLEFVRTKLNQINRTAGDFPAAVIATEQTEVFKLHSAWAAVQVVLIRIGEIIAPVVSEIAAGVARLLQGFSGLSPAMQKVLVFGALAAAAIGPLVFIFGALISPVGLVIAGLIAAAAAGVYLYEKFQIVRNVVKDAMDIFKGFTDAIGLTTPVINRGTVGFGSMSREIQTMNQVSSLLSSTWRSVAPYLTSAWAALSSAARTVAAFVVQEFGMIVSGIRAHTQEIKQTVTTVWNAVVAVTRVVWPIVREIIKTVWDAIKIVVDTSLKAIGQVILAVMNIINGHWSAAWNNIRNLTGVLLHGIVALIETVLRGAISVVLSIAALIGQAIWTGIKRVVPLLAALPAILITAIGAAINAAASAAVGLAVHIGSNIVSGIMSGVGGLASSLAGKLKSEVTSALGGLAGHLGIKSPSSVTRDQIGKPLGEGIVLGFLLGLSDLPSKINAKLRDALQGAQKVVQAAQTSFSNAFTRLSDYAMRAFDASTTAHLNQMQTKFDALIKKVITGPLNKAQDQLTLLHNSTMSTIDNTKAQLTPTEQLVATLEENKHQADMQKAVRDALDKVHDAQQKIDDLAAAGGGSVEEAKDAQNALLDAQTTYQDSQYALALDGLQKKAAAERKAADDAATIASQAESISYANQQQALNDKYALMQDNMTKLYNSQVLNYQSERDLQKQHLGDILAALQTQLSKHPEEWAKIHTKIMKMFRDDFGPDYKTAGTNLGIGFAKGIRESFGTVEATLHEFATLVAKYLKLRSPAEVGPLSDLDTWWTKFVPTIAAGIDHAAMGDVLTGALSSRASAVGTNTSGRGSLTQQGTREGTSPLVHIENQHVYNELDPELAAITIGRKLAFR